MITVRANRLRCALIAVIGIPLSFMLVVLDPKNGDPTIDVLWRFGGALAGWLAFWCLWLLLRGWYFTFDTRRRRVTTSGRWKEKGIYPRRKFDRIEYSVYDARIYEVAASGKRRRLPVRRWFADRRDWEALVDAMLRHQADMRASAEERHAPAPTGHEAGDPE